MISRQFALRAVLLVVFALLAVPVDAQGMANAEPPSAASAVSVPGVQQQGIFLVAPVSVDGAQLFTLVTFAGNQELMTRRYLTVQTAIDALLSETPSGATLYDPDGFKIVMLDEGGQEVLAAVDARHRIPLPIVTVTEADAEYHHLTAHAVAFEWQRALQPTLAAALVRRQPELVRANERTASIATIVLLMVTVLAALVLWVTRKRDNSERVSEATLRVLAVVWLIHIVYTFLLFPQTSSWGHFALDAGRQIAIIWICAFLLDAYIGYVIGRFAHHFARRKDDQLHDRRVLRAPTIRAALSDFKRVIVIFVASLAMLSALQIPIASVVTIGSAAAVIVGFAGQTLVRDCLNGLAILVEDQYVVGDYVMIGDYNGIVENLSLRMVQIRDGHGSLISIPHSAATSVVNASRDWSRVDYRIAVDAQADIVRAIATLRTAIEALSSNERCEGTVVLPADFVGVQEISKEGVVLRASVRTAPMRQFEVRRILNERVLEAFNDGGIPLGNDPSSLGSPSTYSSPVPM